MNNKAEALREKIDDLITSIILNHHTMSNADMARKQKEIIALCAEVARDCADGLFLMDGDKQSFDEAINNAFGVSNEEK